MTWNAFSERELVERLSSLTSEGRLAFAASCCERMIPNYDAFVSVEGLDDSGACRRAVDAVWRWSAREETPQEEILHLKQHCQEAISEPERFDSVWCGLATNAVSAIMDALDCCLSGSAQSAANTGVLADDSVYEYVSRADTPMSHSQVQERGTVLDRWMTQHPLKTEEIKKQLADIELLASTQSVTRETIQHLQRTAKNFGIQPFRRGMVKR